ncbi:MAG: gliding motility-associated C-terminal domain-containing protein, partial [Sphingobacteriales bacterium]
VGNSQQLLIDKNDRQSDYYGDFPLASPNGSRYILKLGNEDVRAQAEQASYTFTVPAGSQRYTIIYYYAVVFQNPNHQYFQQPKFTSKVFDVTEGKYIECGAYEFVSGYQIPGFELSEKGKDVYYKSWSPISINLSGYAGKTIRLEFTNNDCTEGGHFGYAYLDMNQNCADPITGNVICVGTTELTLQAPPGFMEYKWLSGDLQTELGTNPSLNLKPAPNENTSFLLRLVPYPGLGCIDSIPTFVRLSEVPLNLVVPSTLESCPLPGIDLTPANIKSGSSPGLSFMYYADPGLNELLMNPGSVLDPGNYYIQATNSVGCTVAKPVNVVIHPYPDFTVTDPTPVQYPLTVNLRSAVTGFGNSYSFWKDEQLTTPLLKPESLNNRGTYYVKGISAHGCVLAKPVVVKINPSPEPLLTAPNAFTPNNDGLNDRFRLIVNDRVKLIELRIYDRWGKIIHRSNDLEGGWQPDKQPAGLYVWVAEAEDIFSKKQLRKSGSLQLVR